MNGMEAGQFANGVVAIATEPSYLSAFCSGANLEPFLIVTAAHCVIDKNGNAMPNIYVSKPGTVLDSKTEWVEASRIFAVNGWKNDTNFVEQDDIAFLTVRNNFNNSIFDEFANLETLRQVRMGDQYVWHLGYGIRQYSGNMSSTPQLLGLMPHNGGISNLNFDSFIRTSGSSTQSTCPGDSGGPAFSKIGNKIVLLGVLTGGNGCSLKYQKEYIITSFAIQHYGMILDKARVSSNQPVETPKDLSVSLSSGEIQLKWTYPRTQNDESLIGFEVLNNDKVVCSKTYKRQSPYFTCNIDALVGKNELVLKSIGMRKSQLTQTYQLNAAEQETKAGILKAQAEAAAKAQAEAAAKAQAEAAAKAQAEAAAKAQAKPSVTVKPAIIKITCIKGSSKRIISGVKPKCPAGYKIYK